MVNIRGRERTKSFDSPRGEVGEIDTRAPFQSVKAAVSLFGEVAITRRPSIKKSRLSAENVLEKETQLLLVQRDLDKYKQQLESAESTKTKAASELERAKSTLKDLTNKLKTVNDSKQSAMEASEAVKKKTKQLEVAKSQKQLGNDAQKQELDTVRHQYRVTAKELDAAKQELTKIRQDFDAALESKWASFQRAAEGQRTVKVSAEKADELSKQIKAMRQTYEQLKVASAQAEEQQSKMIAEKDAHVQACKNAKEEAKSKLESLKKEYNHEVTKNFEVKLAETTAEIEVLQEEMKNAHASEMKKVSVLTAELEEATKTLQEVAQEESRLQNLLASLRQELEDVKRERTELLSAADKKELKAFEEQSSKLEQILSETESERKEAEEMKKNAEEFRQEAENARLMAEEAEKNLELALRQAEEAKAAEKQACEEMKVLSKGENIDNKDTGKKIKISLEKFNSLKNKVPECQGMAETKQADALVQVEAINLSKNEAEKKLEAILKSIEEIKEATEIALRSAQMAESAQTVVEGELRKRREEQETIAA